MIQIALFCSKNKGIIVKATVVSGLNSMTQGDGERLNAREGFYFTRLLNTISGVSLGFLLESGDSLEYLE